MVFIFCESLARSSSEISTRLLACLLSSSLVGLGGVCPPESPIPTEESDTTCASVIPDMEEMIPAN